MATITTAYIDERISYLRTDHSFHIANDDEFGRTEELPRFLHRAAGAAGMRVRARIYEDDDAWVCQFGKSFGAVSGQRPMRARPHPDIGLNHQQRFARYPIIAPAAAPAAPLSYQADQYGFSGLNPLPVIKLA